ncbi:MAG: glycosyltransferase [Flavobacteriales bacterium]|nr:glycosyltransferase [Flavobacteriales bacterium]
MNLSVIIPVYNEEESLPGLFENLEYFFNTKYDQNTEIVFVDDGSTDRTAELILNNRSRSYPSKLVRLSKNYGSHAALNAGVSVASGELIVNLNADLQDPLELIPKLSEKIHEGNDIVWAHRKTTQTGIVEKTFSGLFALLVQKFINKNYPGSGLDVVMYNSKVRKQLLENQEINSSYFLQIMNLGFNQDSIYFDRKERKLGRSKWSLSKKIKLMLDTFVSFSYAPVRLVTIVGILFSLIGFMWMIYIIFRKIFVGDLVSGWPALISILMLGFGITNLSLGIIAEYLWRILDASRNRKSYIISEVKEIPKSG